MSVHTDGTDYYVRYADGRLAWLDPTEVEACLVACGQRVPLPMPEGRATGANAAKRKRRNANRRARDAAARSYGLFKVRGAMGGTYWE